MQPAPFGFVAVDVAICTYSSFSAGLFILAAGMTGSEYNRNPYTTGLGLRAMHVPLGIKTCRPNHNGVGVDFWAHGRWPLRLRRCRFQQCQSPGCTCPISALASVARFSLAIFFWPMSPTSQADRNAGGWPAAEPGVAPPALRSGRLGAIFFTLRPSQVSRIFHQLRFGERRRRRGAGLSYWVRRVRVGLFSVSAGCRQRRPSV